MNKLMTQFKIIAQCKNISKASEELHIGQSTLSKNMYTLEENLNCKLLERNNKGVTLTPSGEIFYHHVCIMSMHYKNALREMNLLGKHNEILKIGSGYDWDSEILPLALKQTSQDFPNTQVFIENGESSEMAKKIIEGTFDMVLGQINTATYHISNLEITELVKVKWVLFAHKNSPLRRHKNISKDDLDNKEFTIWYSFLPGESFTMGNTATMRYFHNNNMKIPIVKVGSSSLTTVMEIATLDDKACLLLPQACAKTALRYGFLPLHMNNIASFYRSGIIKSRSNKKPLLLALEQNIKTITKQLYEDNLWTSENL